MANQDISRRQFLRGAAAAGLAAMAGDGLALQRFTPIVDNPLRHYPNRDWERIYRDMARHDSTFTFLCAPNDTHNCLLTAYVRNGVVVRIGPTYGYGQAEDLNGFRASSRWEPRCCQKGLALAKRFYGDRRVKGAMVRKGFRDWAEAGFPRDPETGRAPEEYFQRGKEGWIRMEWDEAYALVARAYVDIAETYSGEEGQAKLMAQGYDPAMVEVTGGAGTQTLKVRGGMPFLGATRIFGLNRFANSLALLDAHVRGTGPEDAVGARGWDSYSWHTDLPPGHPMVTGQQTVEFDLFTAENAELITIWGLNWISTKMPDGHWLTEARQHGAKIVTIATEYQSTSNKADEVLIIRPGTDAALALGLARIIMDEGLYDEGFVHSFTDLPLLVRSDTLQLLRASEVFPDYQQAPLSNYTRILEDGEEPDPNHAQSTQFIPAAMRRQWGDFVVWDPGAEGPAPVNRDEVGEHFEGRGLRPALDGRYTVETVNGETVEVRPLYSLIREYLDDFGADSVSKITWLPEDAVVKLAREIAAHPAKTLLAHGMGPNHFFNADLKDRAIFLVAALTRNIGHLGGSPGSYAGNYRVALFNGFPQYITENPFDIELDPDEPARTASYFKYESAHYYNYGDRPLRAGETMLTGDSHMPAPTKSMWLSNSNSILGNTKWSYDVIHNTLPKMEAIIINDWWWTMSCEYADVVFGVDSWGEFKHPDMCGSVTNPFVTVFPRTPLPRIFDTRSDIETYAGVSEKLAELTGDSRFVDYWKFVGEGRVDVYLQRIVDASSGLRGYRFAELEERARRGVPSLQLLRTYPKVGGWEQTQESKPWYTKTGRLEFYREEREFIEYGENLPVYREPVDATPHEPNVIVGAPHDSLRPHAPSAYGLDPDDRSSETRQVRNVFMTPDELMASKHPGEEHGLQFLFLTPKYRHGAHTTPVDLDFIAAYFGPFGDVYRKDKRAPWVGESYVDINPQDAKELGIDDGDYIWIDSDPTDRPYRGASPDDPDYKVSRMMCRARYYNGTPRSVLRMWFNMYQASHGSVEAHETREDKLARNPETNYQAMFRYGGHQSATRAWLRPTLMTDSLVRKEGFGQSIGQGFLADVHCPVGAPKESFVKIAKAEAGGLDGEGLWRPAALGYRPTYESDDMKAYLEGRYVDED